LWRLQLYDEMSKLLNDLIKQKRDDTEAYEEFLKNAEVLVRKLVKGQSDAGLPSVLQGNRQATTLFNNLIDVLSHDNVGDESDQESERLDLALKLDTLIKSEAPAGWKGDEVKERVVQNLIHKTLGKGREATWTVFQLVKNQPGY
jgi:type I restriction enzyme R subunit